MDTRKYIYKHTSNPWESNHRDGPAGHKNKTVKITHSMVSTENSVNLNCHEADAITNTYYNNQSRLQVFKKFQPFVTSDMKHEIPYSPKFSWVKVSLFDDISQ